MATVMEPEVRDEAPARPARPAAAQPVSRRRIVFAVMGVVLVLLLAAGVRKYLWSRSHVSTDNAQVDGHVIPILPKVGGFVAQVRVDDNRRVRAGDTLVVLDDRDFQTRLAQAEADLAVALAGVSSNRRGGPAEAAGAEAQADALEAHADLDRPVPPAPPETAPQDDPDPAAAA